MEFLYPGMPFFNRTGIVFWICIVTGVIVSFVTKAKPEAALQGLVWNKSSLTLLPSEKMQQRGMRNPVIWWAVITIIVLYFYIRYA